MAWAYVKNFAATDMQTIVISKSTQPNGTVETMPLEYEHFITTLSCFPQFKQILKLDSLILG